MKKKIIIISFIVIFLICSILFFIINNPREENIVKGDMVEEVVIKEKQVFLTKGYDNINEFLKEEYEEEIIVNYVIEYREENDSKNN